MAQTRMRRHTREGGGGWKLRMESCMQPERATPLGSFFGHFISRRLGRGPEREIKEGKTAERVKCRLSPLADHRRVSVRLASKNLLQNLSNFCSLEWGFPFLITQLEMRGRDSP